MAVKIGLIGAGYWGPNFARIASNSATSELAWCSDLSDKNLDSMKKNYPSVKITKDYNDILNDKEVDAVIVATPAETHYKVAKDCLLAGKHVLIEKPMSYSTQECVELVEIAEKSGKKIMVGHTFEYNSAVRKIKEYIDKNELGDIYYIYLTRVNLGRIREDVNAMWNLAPHDVSMLIYFLGMPLKVNAFGYSFIQKDIEDVVFMVLEFPNNVIAKIHVSWLDPSKIREMTLVGSKKMIVFDDMDNESKLRIYDKGVTKQLGDNNAYGQYQIKLRAGDIILPKIDMKEPLKEEYEHFIECVRDGKESISNGKVGLNVVKVLEAAQKSIKNNGMSVQIE